jgi:hypothetical protein
VADHGVTSAALPVVGDLARRLSHSRQAILSPARVSGVFLLQTGGFLAQPSAWSRFEPGHLDEDAASDTVEGGGRTRLARLAAAAAVCVTLALMAAGGASADPTSAPGAETVTYVCDGVPITLTTLPNGSAAAFTASTSAGIAVESRAGRAPSGGRRKNRPAESSLVLAPAQARPEQSVRPVRRRLRFFG